MTFEQKIIQLENDFRTFQDYQIQFKIIERFISTNNNKDWLGYANSNVVYQNYKKDMIEYYKQQNQKIKLFYWLNAKKYEYAFKFILKIIRKPILEFIYTERPFQKEFNRLFFSLSENEMILFSQDDISECKAFFSLLADEKSKKVLLYILMAKITLKLKYFKAVADSEEIDQYFDRTIISCNNNEIFIDCGGYIGDTALNFFKNFQCKKYYLYEPDIINMEKAKKNLSQYGNIQYRPLGVSDAEEMKRFVASNGSSSSYSKDGNIEVKTVSLDKDVDEKIHFIKMDIEGFEIKALMGAKEHITKDKPKLAISVYHKKYDLWEIPKLIYQYNSNYKFYLRHYSSFCNETVLYCI